MGNTTSIEEEAGKRTCALCKNILSVPPIILLSEDGTRSKCGRCENVPNETKGRNSDFEYLAKMLSFPCIYEGCNKKIAWNEVSKHEEECVERTVMCPIITFPSCKAVVQVRNLEEHMKKMHPLSLYHDLFTIKLSLLCETHSYVLMRKNQSFFMIFRKMKSSLLVYVVSLNNDGFFNYHLKLVRKRTNTDDFCILYENLPITKYIERKHCFHCINKICHLLYHPHSQNYKNVSMNIKWKLINLTYVQKILGDISDITLAMEISDLGTKNNCTITQPPLSDSNNPMYYYSNQNILRNSLQCPICIEYMIGSIHNCTKGHTVCQECRRRLTICPFCHTPFSDSRNFALENLAEEVVFTCIFSRSGCEVTGKVVRLWEHEKKCGFKDIGEDTKI